MDWTKEHICYVSENLYVKEVNGKLIGVKTGDLGQEERDEALKYCGPEGIKWEEG